MQTKFEGDRDARAGRLGRGSNWASLARGETSMTTKEHIIRTLGYTAVFVVFVVTSFYFIATLPNEDQQKMTWVK
jgi:hypothetical protein